MAYWCKTVLTALLLGQFLSDSALAKPNSAEVAKRVDRAIADAVFNENTQLAPITNDETYLRRVYLDIVGDIPTPEAITAFVLDPSKDKRQSIVEQLLDDPHYGQNWARYWRDVVFYRAQEVRSKVATNAMVADLTKQLNEGEGWDKIASDFITAQGDAKDVGHTAIIMAQDGRTEETTAEVSRIFLGIQIQCAQCHDHPYDRWKREQFHELAAFFPRIGVRNVNQLTKRSIEVFSNDRYRGKQPRKNNDRRPQAEHLMSDLENPDQPGKAMQPKFFLTGASLSPGALDAERRYQLAQWLTDNEWFATALVNRIWAELVGEGFYTPIDDIGPDRQATAPNAVELLSQQFRESGYDLKWLIATICQTEAYQREARPRRGPSGTPFVANVPQRLRSDQLFSALYSALEVTEKDPAKAKGPAGAYRQATDRTRFEDLFGYDPSVARDSVSATIPQSLALMNSVQVDRLITARRTNILGRLLKEIDDDEALVVELYLRCLSRQPSEDELVTALGYRTGIKKRQEAFEDLLWALINSAEFQHRR